MCCHFSGRGAQKARFSEREAIPADHVQEQIGPEGQLDLTGKRIAHAYFWRASEVVAAAFAAASTSAPFIRTL
jgi:hypothetical protein